MHALKVWAGTTAALLAGAMLAPAWAQEKAAEEAAALPPQGVPLKHRVSFVAIPSATGTATDAAPAFIVKSESWKALSLLEGVVISGDDWATASDLTRATLAKSDLFRVVEVPKTWSGVVEPLKPGKAVEGMPSMLLLARYGIGANGKTAYFTLVDPFSGGTVKQAQATAADMREAVDKALAELEREAAMRAWRCRVIGVKDKQMVIDRGRLDGLRAGQQFLGYKIEAAADAPALAEEAWLMMHGKRTGSYKLVEEGQEFSKVEGVESAPVLAAGDILEIPEIVLKDRGKASRGTRTWDKIYEK